MPCGDLSGTWRSSSLPRMGGRYVRVKITCQAPLLNYKFVSPDVVLECGTGEENKILIMNSSCWIEDQLLARVTWLASFHNFFQYVFCDTSLLDFFVGPISQIQQRQKQEYPPLGSFQTNSFRGFLLGFLSRAFSVQLKDFIVRIGFNLFITKTSFFTYYYDYRLLWFQTLQMIFALCMVHKIYWRSRRRRRCVEW